MTNPDHISITQIETYQGCPEQWRLRYIEKIPMASSPAVVRGRAVHKTVAAQLRRKRDTGDLPSIEEVRDVAASQAHAGFELSEVRLTSDEAGLGITAVRAQVVDASVAMATAYREKLAPSLDPQDIEQEVRVSVAGLPTMVSVLDLTEKNHTIRDLKTRSRSPLAGEAAKSSQLSQYHLNYLAYHKRPPAKLTLDILSAKKPTPDDPSPVRLTVLSTKRTAEQLQSHLDSVVAVKNAMDAGISFPNLTSWKCDPRYCSFFAAECVYTRGARR